MGLDFSRIGIIMGAMATKQAAIYTKIPAWLYDLVLRDAKKNRRSLAAQIAMVLERRYRRQYEAQNGAAKP